ncbi:MAG: ABC transporter substrate-binding protein [Magnetococcales bacterium]|nr:ABC transporter substrate-binding protein [Magnetococcales bacterium]
MALVYPFHFFFNIRHIFVVLACCFLWHGAPVLASEGGTIRLLSYHNHPPFVTGPEQGLSFDVARMLTAFAAGTWKFQVRIVPRNRLDLELAPWIQGRCLNSGGDPGCGDDWSLLWVNPAWGFGENAGENFLWLKQFEDSNIILSRTESPVDYQSPESLAGLRLGGIRGHRYLGLDPLVTAGKIQRVDGDHERDNILKLLMKRVDVLLLPTSTVRYFLTQDATIRAAAGQIFVAPTRHQQFWRHFMIPSTRKDLEKVYGDWLATGAFPKGVGGE